MSLWLTAMSMDEYASEFTARGVDGTELLLLDGEKLKVRENWSGSIFLFCFFLHFILFCTFFLIGPCYYFFYFSYKFDC